MTVTELKESLEDGKLYWRVLDLEKACRQLENVVEYAHAQKCWDLYFDALEVLLRIYIETGNHIEVATHLGTLLEISQYEKICMPAKMHYIRGIHFCYQGKFNLAYNCFEKLESKSRQNGDYKNLCYALQGKMIYHYKHSNNLDAANSIVLEIKDLIASHQFADFIPMFKISEARLYIEKKEFDKAKECLEDAEKNQGTEYNGYFTANLLFFHGYFYLAQEKYKEALKSFKAADAIVSKKNLVSLDKQITYYIDKIEARFAIEGKMKVKLGKDIIIQEPSKGELILKQSSILKDVFQFLLLNQGSCVSKETLVNTIWRESYNPLIHDNKIYVTLNRLRSILEPNPRAPKYLIRNRDGYRLDNFELRDLA